MPQPEKLSESTPEQRTARLEYIDKVWKYLSDQGLVRLDAAVNMLMLTNAGGAVATLSFMGAMKTVEPVPRAPAMLALFLTGVVLVGILRAIHYYRVIWVIAGWRDDVERFFKDSLNWSELLSNHRARTTNFVAADIVGWASFLCFVAGTVLGYAGLFKLGA